MINIYSHHHHHQDCIKQGRMRSGICVSSSPSPPNHRLIILIILIIRTASSRGELGQALVQVDLESAVFVSSIFFFLMHTILDHQISRVVIYSTKHGGTRRIWRQDRRKLTPLIPGSLLSQSNDESKVHGRHTGWTLNSEQAPAR